VLLPYVRIINTTSSPIVDIVTAHVKVIAVDRLEVVVIAVEVVVFKELSSEGVYLLRIDSTFLLFILINIVIPSSRTHLYNISITYA